jgi:putative membrane protein
MHVGSWSFLGMHAFWWVFWIGLLIWAYRWAMSKVKKAGSGGGDTPRDVLQRRYAAGEITTQEYEDRKAKLTRDREVG